MIGDYRSTPLVRTLAAVLILAACTLGLFWKITLAPQYTWLDSPDLVNQVLPWLQESTRQFKGGHFPVWDSHHWAGYPLPGQAQPGVLFPLNWLLALTPFENGHLRLPWLNWYFTLIHFLAALSAFLLCRDRGCSRTAAIAGATVFGLGGFMGGITWPQMLNGAMFAPLVLLFVFRCLDGKPPLLNGALAGCSLGVSLWSGHHQVPIFIGLAEILAILAGVVARRITYLQAAVAGASAGAFTLMTGMPALWTSREFYMHAFRWVGAQNPVEWADRVPYIAHEPFSLSPAQLIALVVPHLYSNVVLYVGVTALLLAALAVVLADRFESRVWTLLGAMSLLYAFGRYTPVHGILYAVVPTLDKARNVQFAIVVLHLSIAVLAAFGIDLLRTRSRERTIRAAGLICLGAAALAFSLAAVSSVQSPDAVSRDPLAAAGLAGFSALIVGSVLLAVNAGRLSGAAVAVLLAAMVFLDTGEMTGVQFRHRELGWGILNPMLAEDETAKFLRQHLGAQRFRRNGDEVQWNFGDWHNLDEQTGYLSPLTSVLKTRFGPEMLGVVYYLSKTPRVPGQKVVFENRTGLKVFEEQGALPRAWTVHEIRSYANADELNNVLEHGPEQLRKLAAVRGSVSGVESCAGDDSVQLNSMEPTRTALTVDMRCRGLLVVSNAMFAGWSVSVDGAQADLREANGFMQSVVVPNGRHRVEFRYTASALYRSWACAAVGLLGTGFLKLRARRTG